jgi:hypothetical protein
MQQCQRVVLPVNEQNIRDAVFDFVDGFGELCFSRRGLEALQDIWFGAQFLSNLCDLLDDPACLVLDDTKCVESSCPSCAQVQQRGARRITTVEHVTATKHRRREWCRRKAEWKTGW